ncbi:unnamed protein product [Hermetia illucens]|uniref:Uncharacterized protein n=1 Tax=Hermetia illucens TaxID=343691 RepID=A0A7R8UDW2_HERIL|nr:unnamed protein product [Hermetia illucens]
MVFCTGRLESHYTARANACCQTRAAHGTCLQLCIALCRPQYCTPRQVLQPTPSATSALTHLLCTAADGSATRIHNYNDGGNSGELKSRTPHKTIHKPKLIAFFGERYS